jgi:hypothetical protein
MPMPRDFSAQTKALASVLLSADNCGTVHKHKRVCLELHLVVEMKMLYKRLEDFSEDHQSRGGRAN